MEHAKDLFSYRKHWAHRFGTAPVLPMSREEMDDLGWDSCDVILVTGDAYIDHPSFGAAVIGRLLEAQGFRVGIIAQPDWRDAEAFAALGRPNLFFGVTAGNMDSMVNRYTADRKVRSDDAYSPDAEGNRRPDRATLVYAQRCREAFKEVPVVLGGIEASLRRLAHYDYWSDKVRRSVLPDAKADLLLYGNAERAVVELAHRLAAGEPIGGITDLRGTAVLRRSVPEEWTVVDGSDPERPPRNPRAPRERCVVRLPAYEQVKRDPVAYAHASRLLHLETNPGNARALIQRHGDREVWVNPPPIPLETVELDRIFELPYTRRPHPVYGEARVPAYEMIRFSVNIMRGCFGGCTFCSITEHEGRIIQNRSEDSIAREVQAIRENVPGFTGVISDLGGPTANMYRMRCEDPDIESACRRLSCVYPEVCPHMQTDHRPLIRLYRRVRESEGVKKVVIASGVRYDLAVRDPEYVKELVAHHVGGYLKIAPEHTESGPLAVMQKPGMDVYHRFKKLFDRYSQQAGKEQYLIPYFISAHPGSRDEDMLELALWLKDNGFRLDQVQNFLPTPMTLATAMYHTGRNPLRRVDSASETLSVPRGGRQRRVQKAFLRYHAPENAAVLREALQRLGRDDLIRPGKKGLVPPAGPAAGKPVRKGGRRKGV
ncbi:MAG TPA: YgiQ family radical SAM protein [Gammaproteobacteria bacterium]|nr:YgiQ family radical SAM protein [Gammaproteobacteria bacterium]